MLDRRASLTAGLLVCGLLLVAGAGVVAAGDAGSSSVPVEEWNTTYSIGDYGRAWDVEQTANGYVVVGRADVAPRSDEFDVSGLVLRVGSDGTVRERTTVGGSGIETFYDVTVTDDGNYVAVGSADPGGEGNEDVLVAKISPEGTVLWNRTYDAGGDRDTGKAVVPAHGGGYAVAADSESTGPGGSDVGLLWVDGEGDLFRSEFYGTAGADEFVWDLERTTDGYALAGRQVSGGTTSALVVKANPTLGQEGFRTYAGDGEARAFGIEETADGNYVFAGWTRAVGSAEEDAYVVEVDAETADVVWSRTVGEPDTGEQFASVEQGSGGANAGSLLLAGQKFGNVEASGSSGPLGAWVVRTTADGATQWSTVVGGPEKNLWGGGVPTDDGGFVVAGENESVGASGQVWVYRAAPNQPPSAALSVSPDDPKAGETVTFDASGSSDPDDASVSYEWAVDGNELAFESGARIEYTFESAGNHTVEVRVTDEHGATDAESVVVDVARNTTPETSVTVEAPPRVPPGRQATITVLSENAGELSVEGEVDGWVVNATDPASLFTSPNPGETPSESQPGDVWGHVYGSVGAHAFEVTVTAPETTGTYKFTATATVNETTATRNVTVVVTNVTDHPSGVPQYVFDAIAGADGELDRPEVIDAVRKYVRDRPVAGVELTRTEVVDLVSYYVRQ